MITSIATTPSLGPPKPGYIIYVGSIASVVNSLGSLGVPASRTKYMAEFIGMDDFGTARHILQNDDVADRLGHTGKNRMTPRDTR